MVSNFLFKIISKTLSLFIILFLILIILVVFLGGQLLQNYPKGVWDGKIFSECMVTKMFEIYFCPNATENNLTKSNDISAVNITTKNNLNYKHQIQYIPFVKISNFLKKSVLISEDSGFYQHKGFDFNEIKKSYETNVIVGTYKRGGSTITQQLAKNLFLSKEKTMQRKASEAFYTVQLEKFLTKDQILERYLNVVQFGNDLFGVQAASKYYFDKTASDLSLNESVFLAVLLPNPIKYAQSFHKQKLSAFIYSRMKDVLFKLNSYQRISETEYTQALAQLPTFFKNGIDSSALENLEKDNEENGINTDINTANDTGKNTDKNTDKSKDNEDGLKNLNELESEPRNDFE